MWLGNVDADGILQCTTDPVASDSTFVGGIAISSTGETHITETLSDLFINGFMVSTTGQLVVDIDGVIDEYLMGMPRTSTGALVVQSGSPLSSDPFVAGIRVENTGGVFISSGTPAIDYLTADDGSTVITADDGTTGIEAL